MTLVNFVNEKQDDTVEFGELYVDAVFEYCGSAFKKVSCGQAIKLDTLTLANFNQSDSVLFLRSFVEVEVEDGKETTVFAALRIGDYFMSGGECMRKAANDAAINIAEMAIYRIQDERTVYPSEPVSVRVTVKPNVVSVRDDDDF